MQRKTATAITKTNLCELEINRLAFPCASRSPNSEMKGVLLNHWFAMLVIEVSGFSGRRQSNAARIRAPESQHGLESSCF